MMQAVPLGEWSKNSMQPNPPPSAAAASPTSGSPRTPAGDPPHHPYAAAGSGSRASEPAPAHAPSERKSPAALADEIEQLRVERARWLEIQRGIMDLLGTKSPDRILHDLRNVLNERELLRSLAQLGA